MFDVNNDLRLVFMNGVKSSMTISKVDTVTSLARFSETEKGDSGACVAHGRFDWAPPM